MNLEQMWALAHQTVRSAKGLGADEVSVGVSRHSELSLTRRAGKLEQATQATSLSLSLSLLVEDRFSAHSSSDLRPEALQAFLERAVAATRVLEPEVERRLPELSQCGIGATAEELDLYDASWVGWPVEARRERVLRLEQAVDALPERAQILSATSYHSDSEGQGIRVMSNGFEATNQSTGFGQGVDVTLSEAGGRRPEAMAWYSARHLSDLPALEKVAAEAYHKATLRLDSKPIASGRYPLLLDAPSVGRILGVLGGPISGSELHQGRSCMAGKLGTQIASDKLTLLDAPLIRRGLGSRPYDGDAFKAVPMPVIEAGVLKNYYISLYYGRKLGMPTTTGGRSNWVVAPGQRSPAEILRELPKCILVNGFLGGNSNGLTGDFSFGVQGLLYEYGEVTAHLSEMNISGNINDFFMRLVEPASDVWSWSSLHSPSLLFEGVDFSGV